MKQELFGKRKILLKFISLVGGFFIWIYVVSAAQIELSKTLPLKVDIPKEFAIKNDLPNEVMYRVKGPGIFTRKYVDDKAELLIKKEFYYKKGKKKFNINFDKVGIKLPLGVELLEVRPRSFSLELEKSSSQRVKIKSKISPVILEKYKIGKIKIRPQKIMITGPRSVVRGIKFVETEEIDSLTAGINKDLKILLTKPDKRVDLSQSNISANIELLSKLKVETLKKVPIVFQSSKLIKNASHKYVDLKVEADENLLKDIDLSEFKVFAIVRQNSSGTTKVKLITKLPQGIKELEVVPREIKVVVE